MDLHGLLQGYIYFTFFLLLLYSIEFEVEFVLVRDPIKGYLIIGIDPIILRINYWITQIKH
jgi:hypothetical protein